MNCQEDAAKRHAENLENIRQKAFELSVQKCSSDEGVPVIEPYKTKKKVSKLYAALFIVLMS